MACYLLAAAALAAHVALCYPAAVCRGYPPIHPFWEYIAPYLAYLAITLFPLFDDSLKTLRGAKLTFLWMAVFMNGVTLTNLASGRPSIGHLTGIMGIIAGDPIFVALDTLLLAAFILPIGLLLSLAAERAWSHCRGFADEGASCSWVRFTTIGLLGSVAVVAAFCSVGIWAVRAYRERPNRTWSHACRNNLKAIGLAMQNYHDVYGSLPPAYVTDEEGRPMHSWRVLLLPFLGEQSLYNAYRFDEPWHGPHNRGLAEQIPQVYRCRWDLKAQPSWTSYAVVVGPETVFPGQRSMSLKAVGDGTSETILAVEVPHSGIIWTEPRDLPFDEFALGATQLPRVFRKMHGLRITHAHVVFAAGRERLLDAESAPIFKSLLTANGCEEIVGDY